MHYPTYSYALSLQEKTTLSDATVLALTLMVILAATVYIIGKIKE